MSSKDKEKDRDKKHKKNTSSSSSSGSKSSSSSDSKKKKSSSHKSSSRTTQNTRRDTPNDEYNEQNDDLPSIDEGGQEGWAGSPYDGSSNATDVTQRYPAPIGHTHARPSRSELPSRLEPSQTQGHNTVPAYYAQPTSTQYDSTRAPASYPTSSPYYSPSGALPQAQQASYNSQMNYNQTTNTQQPPGGLGSTGYPYSPAPVYGVQQNRGETDSEFPTTSDLAAAIGEVASYTHAQQDSPPASPDAIPRGETRTQPWQSPSLQQNLHHGPLEPWNENSTDKGTIYDDTNRVKREDDVTGS